LSLHRATTLFRRLYLALPFLLAVAVLLIAPAHGFAQTPPLQTGGEASLVIPDLSQGTFLGANGRTLLMGGLGICALGLLFGLITYMQLRDLPVHSAMLEVSELMQDLSLHTG